ncbi:MAG: response regulator [Deltaproteobacteria bacterium]|nr:response regulator [Deltaproteobacteria bacterium]
MSFASEPITVLCVDDDLLMLNTLRRVLSVLQQELRVVTTDNAVEALNIMRSEEVGVAFIDLVMPNMDGFELLQEMRRISPSTELVMFTAEDDPSKVVAAIKAGATDYLTKPIDNQRLRTVVVNLAERYQLAKENQRLWRALRAHREQAFAGRPIRILIVDDNPDDAIRVRRIFERESSGTYVVETISSGKEVVAACEQFRPDCIILDYYLPDATGEEVLDLLSNEEGQINIAVVVVTGFGDEQVAQSALRKGAADFLVKSNISSELMHRAVFGALEKMDMMRKARKQEEDTAKKLRLLELRRDSLIYDANHDPLTGVLNRRGMEKKLKRVMHKRARKSDNFSLAMCDIDLFKTVNDTHGHQVGDDVLEGVAIRLKQQMRGTDFVCRYGGEEFLLFIENLESDLEPYERLRSAVANEPIDTRNGKVPITISIGVALGVRNIDAGIAAADTALYDAKTQGRNRVVATQPFSQLD